MHFRKMFFRLPTGFSETIVLGVIWHQELMPNAMLVAEVNKVAAKLGATVTAN